MDAGRAEKTEDRLPSEHRLSANEWKFHSEKSFVGELIGKFDSFDSKLDYVSIMCSWNWFFRTWLVSNTKMANSKETFSIGSRWSPPVSLQRGNSVCLWLFRGQLLDIWTNRPGRRLISQKFAASRGMAYSPSRYASLYTEACPPRRSILIIRRFENIKSFVYLAIERYELKRMCRYFLSPPPIFSTPENIKQTIRCRESDKNQTSIIHPLQALSRHGRYFFPATISQTLKGNRRAPRVFVGHRSKATLNKRDANVEGNADNIASAIDRWNAKVIRGD